jgi:hypothetical protein
LNTERKANKKNCGTKCRNSFIFKDCANNPAFKYPLNIL